MSPYTYEQKIVSNRAKSRFWINLLMAKLKIFVSSTVFDLEQVRNELESFFKSLHFEPVLSDKGDVYYDFNLHTHSSCVAEVASADLLMVIIGGRHGGIAVDEAVSMINPDKLMEWSMKGGETDIGKFSITQLEVMHAVEKGIPVFPLIHNDLLVLHNVYEKNKPSKNPDVNFDKLIIPGIQKNSTGIFEFINSIRKRSPNNAYYKYQSIADIKDQFLKQMSGLLHNVLSEQRNKREALDLKKTIKEGFHGLESLVLASASKTQSDIAFATLKYNRCIDFCIELLPSGHNPTAFRNLKDWSNLLELCGIVGVHEYLISGKDAFPSIAFDRRDKPFLKAGYWGLNELQEEVIELFNEFCLLTDKEKKLNLINAIGANNSRKALRYVVEESESWTQWKASKSLWINENTISTNQDS